MVTPWTQSLETRNEDMKVSLGMNYLTSGKSAPASIFCQLRLSLFLHHLGPVKYTGGTIRAGLALDLPGRPAYLTWQIALVRQLRLSF